jgi:DNA-binding FadR family transcriptional regulator
MQYGHAAGVDGLNPVDVLTDPITMRLAGVLRRVPAGRRLPPERTLAATLGVSRTALRDRLRFLESAGILRRRSGSGTYSQPLDPDALTRTLGIAVMFSTLPAEALLPVLGALDRQAARDAAVRADRALVVRLARPLYRLRDVARPARLMAAHHDFHDMLIDAAANPAILFLRAGVLGTLRRAGLLWPERPAPEPLDCLPDDLSEAYPRHRRIWRAVAANDPAAAAAAFD